MRKSVPLLPREDSSDVSRALQILEQNPALLAPRINATRAIFRLLQGRDPTAYDVAPESIRDNNAQAPVMATLGRCVEKSSPLLTLREYIEDGRLGVEVCLNPDALRIPSNFVNALRMTADLCGEPRKFQEIVEERDWDGFVSDIDTVLSDKNPALNFQVQQ